MIELKNFTYGRKWCGCCSFRVADSFPYSNVPRPDVCRRGRLNTGFSMLADGRMLCRCCSFRVATSLPVFRFTLVRSMSILFRSISVEAIIANSTSPRAETERVMYLSFLEVSTAIIRSRYPESHTGLDRTLSSARFFAESINQSSQHF